MMKTYDSYKDSGIEWIGELPSNWKVRQIRSLFQERKEVVSDKDYEPLSVTKKGIVKQLDNVAKTDNNDSRKKVLTNDYVINSRSDRKGSSGLSRYDGSVSVINIVLKMITDVSDVRYYEYIFKSYDFIEEFFRNGKGIVWDLWSTRYSEMKYIKISLPPLSEQEQIVSYLDEKTSLIDEMVEKKKRKIELLKEYRTSLINTVVTKGLNPDVPMKDTGIEWIGEIPDEWVNSKLKYNSKIIGRIGYRGYTVDDLVDEGQGVITLSPSNIDDGELNLEKRTFLSYEKYYESPEIIIEHDDIIYVQRGSSIGKSSIIPFNHPEMTINPQLVILKKFNCIPRFIYYFLKSEVITTQTNIQISGGSIPLITQNSVENFIVVLPKSKEEQSQIVEYLDSKTKEIDDLVQLEQKKIDFLIEYRQSLISNVVTGKIKVVSE